MFDIDESQFPIIHIHRSGTLSDEQFETFLARFDELMATRLQPYVLVFEMHESAMTPFGQAQRQASWMKERQALLKRQVLGMAFVLPSSVLRFALKVIFQLQPMPVPHEVFNDTDSARRWALARLGR
jgi:hypothetical protein